MHLVRRVHTVIVQRVFLHRTNHVVGNREVHGTAVSNEPVTLQEHMQTYVQREIGLRVSDLHNPCVIHTSTVLTSDKQSSSNYTQNYGDQELDAFETEPKKPNK